MIRVHARSITPAQAPEPGFLRSHIPPRKQGSGFLCRRSRYGNDDFRIPSNRKARGGGSGVKPAGFGNLHGLFYNHVILRAFKHSMKAGKMPPQGTSLKAADQPFGWKG
jgi:hypothetical protein